MANGSIVDVPPDGCNRVQYWAFERLEPYAGKLARTVLGGAKVSNGLGLPDNLLSCQESSKGFCWVVILNDANYMKPFADERRQVEQYAYIEEDNNWVVKNFTKGCPITCTDPIDVGDRSWTCSSIDVCVNPHVYRGVVICDNG